MKRTITVMAVGLALALSATVGAEAQDLNRRPFPEPEMQSKINTARARAMLKGDLDRDIVRTGSGASCGDLILNQSEDSRQPREQIIVADNIINLNSNCKR